MSGEEFNLFSEESLSDLFSSEKKIIDKKVRRDLLRKLTDADRDSLIENYFNEHRFEPIIIDFNDQRKEEYISKYSKYLKKGPGSWEDVVYRLYVPLYRRSIIITLCSSWGYKELDKKSLYKG